jgi:hypothetical protein
VRHQLWSSTLRKGWADATELIVRFQHLSTCDRMLPNGLKHLADEPEYQFVAETLVEFGMSAVGGMRYEKESVSGRDRMRGISAKAVSIVRWQDEHLMLLVTEL